MILTLPQALELIAQKDALILEITAQQDTQIAELTRKLESTQRQLITLQHQMEQMLRRLYGRKSEQLNPNQLMLDSIVLQARSLHESVIGLIFPFIKNHIMQR